MLRGRTRFSSPGRRMVLLVFSAVIVIAAAFLGTAAFRGYRALKTARLSAERLGKLAFSSAAFLPGGQGAGPAFEPVASRPGYTSGALLDGILYLAGPEGLRSVGEGTPRAFVLRTGFELPTAPIVGLASGKLRGAGSPELFVATAGAGLLRVTPTEQGLPAVRQILPADADARELTAVLPLDTGDVLLGTRHHGVLLYNGTDLRQEPLPLAGMRPEALQVTALAKVDGASFLIGTRNAGVFLVRGGTVEQATTANGLPDNDIESLATAGGHAFAGTPDGTAEFDLAAGRWAPQRTLAPGTFSHAMASDGHQLLIGTMDQGVKEVPLTDDGNTHRISMRAAVAVGDTERVDQFVPGRGTMYALADGALMVRSRDGWQTVAADSAAGLTDRNISALAFALDGTLYVGYFDNGLDLLSPQGDVHHLEDDHLFCINRIAFDPNRRVMVAATGDGLVFFDEHGAPRQTLMRRDGLISDHVTDVAFTADGMALATPAGITFLTAAGPESLYAFQGLVNNHVYALASSDEGTAHDRLLAGTLGGLSVLESRAVQRNFTVNNSTLGHNWITAILRSPQGMTLVGTYGAGLETLDAQGHFAPVDLPSGVPRDLVVNPNALFATPSHIYAGTLGHGLLVYSQSAGRWSAITAGLPSLNVTSFAARGGEIYIGTDNGLVRIAEANLP